MVQGDLERAKVEVEALARVAKVGTNLLLYTAGRLELPTTIIPLQHISRIDVKEDRGAMTSSFYLEFHSTVAVQPFRLRLTYRYTFGAGYLDWREETVRQINEIIAFL